MSAATSEAPTDPGGEPDTGEPDRSGRGVGIVRRHQVLSFVVLTFGLSWGWWAFAWAVLVGGDGLSRIVVAPGAFGPPVAGLLVTWAAGYDVRAWFRGLFHWRVPARRYLAALGIPLLIAAGGTAVLAVGGVQIDPGLLTGRVPLFPVVLVFAVILGGGQEEPGWRGFALPRLQADYGALTASLAVGLAWAVWHLPLFVLDAPRNTTGSFGIYLVTVLAISVVLTHLYNASRGSVLLAAIAHGGVNATGVLFPVSQGVGADHALVLDLAMTLPLVVLAVAVIVRYGPDTLAPGGRTTTRNGPDSGTRSGNPRIG